MKIVKRIVQIFGILAGIIVLYLAIVTFAPGFNVPEQPLEQGGQGIGQTGSRTPWERKDVSFEVNGTQLRAWLFLPDNLQVPVPCIIMGHGFGGTRDMGLEPYAIRYQEAGFAVLVFDYRHLGESDGEPRQLVWIPYQLEDWTAAINYARGLKEIDPAKIALWGTSMSGGHVIVTAATDHKIACVVAQCPGLDGRASAELLLERAGIGFLLRMVMHGQRDYLRSWFGLAPHKIPVVGQPGTIACLTTPDAYEFFSKFAPPNYVNQVCARINIRGDKYRPVKHARHVRSPVLLQICEFDSITPKSAAQETEKELGKYAKVIYYAIGHFDIYKGDNLEKAVTDQLNFFKKHL